VDGSSGRDWTMPVNLIIYHSGSQRAIAIGLPQATSKATGKG